MKKFESEPRKTEAPVVQTEVRDVVPVVGGEIYRRSEKFEFNSVKESFKNEAVCYFLEEWSKENLIELKFISKPEWDEKEGRDGGGVFRKSSGKENSKLFISDELALPEIGFLVKDINKQTFGEQSERALKEEKKLEKLAQDFINTGIYLAQWLGSIDEGPAREIAEDLALESYKYGEALLGRDQEIPLSIKDILPKDSTEDLTSEEIDRVDHFFAGDVFYRMLREKLKAPNVEYEEARKETLGEFFSKAAVDKFFFKKAQKEIARNIETPRRMLITAIFNHGIEKLVSEIEMPSGEKFVDGLDISGLRETLREARYRKYSKEIISSIEREIVSKIQDRVSKISYQEGADTPSKILESESHSINCVGASTIAGALMGKLGINYLVGDLPDHSVVLPVFSDGRVEWRDMLAPSFNQDLTEILDKKSKGYIGVVDIINLSKDRYFKGLPFPIKHTEHPNYKYISVFQPESGHQSQTLTNLGVVLSCFGDGEEPDKAKKLYEGAIVAHEDAVAINPKNDRAFCNLGVVLSKRGCEQEAVKSLSDAVAINPKNDRAFCNLGVILIRLRRPNEAIKALERAVAVNKNNDKAFYNLGKAFSILGSHKKKEEAIKMYERAIKMYKNAVAINPKNDKAFYKLGKVFSVLGRSDEERRAIKMYERERSLKEKMEGVV